MRIQEYFSTVDKQHTVLYFFKYRNQQVQHSNKYEGQGETHKDVNKLASYMYMYVPSNMYIIYEQQMINKCRYTMNAFIFMAIHFHSVCISGIGYCIET